MSKTTKFHSGTKSQQRRLLEYLIEIGSITTVEARNILDIMSPAPRILELRGKDHNIVMERVTVDTGRGRHRKVAKYTLLNKGGV